MRAQAFEYIYIYMYVHMDNKCSHIIYSSHRLHSILAYFAHCFARFLIVCAWCFLGPFVAAVATVTAAPYQNAHKHTSTCLILLKTVLFSLLCSCLFPPLIYLPFCSRCQQKKIMKWCFFKPAPYTINANAVFRKKKPNSAKISKLRHYIRLYVDYLT